MSLNPGDIEYCTINIRSVKCDANGIMQQSVFDYFYSEMLIYYEIIAQSDSSHTFMNVSYMKYELWSWTILNIAHIVQYYMFSRDTLTNEKYFKSPWTL